MLEISRFGAALLGVVPKLRTLTQLSGLSIGLVLFLVAYVSNPPNLPALIAAGLIGTSVLLFTLSLNVLGVLPEGQRVKFILASFFGFLATVTIFFSIAIYFLLNSQASEQKGRASSLVNELRQKYSFLQAKSETLVRDKKEFKQNIEAASSGPYADLTTWEGRYSEIDAVLTDTVKQMEIVVQLLSDLASPNTHLTEIISRAERNLGAQPKESLTLISAASAATRPGNLAEDFGARILNGISSDDNSYITKCLDAAWVYEVRGQYEEAQVTLEKLDSVGRAKNNPRVLETKAELAAIQGKFSDSINLTDELIKLLESATTPDFMAIALARKDRASRSWANGDLPTAEKFYRLAKDAYERSPAPRKVVNANIQNELGYYYYLKGDLPRSSETFQTAGAYFDVVGSSNYGKPHTFNNIALLYTKLGRYTDAKKYLRRSIEIQEEMIGKRTRLHATALINLANLLLQVGEFKDAEVGFEEAETILERWNDTAASKRLAEFGSATVLFFTGNRGAALPRLFLAAKNLAAATDPGSSRPTSTWVQLSRLYRLQGDAASAQVALSSVESSALQRAPAAWREFLIERGTLEAWISAGGRSLTTSTEEDFRNLASNPTVLASPFDYVRFLLWSTLRDLANAKEDQAAADICEVVTRLQGEIARNVQLLEEVNLVRGRFSSIPRCL